MCQTKQSFLDNLGTSNGVMVSKNISSEFDFRWVLHAFGLVPN